MPTFATGKNKISHIPSEIGLLPNLEYLDLSTFAFVSLNIQKDSKKQTKISVFDFPVSSVKSAVNSKYAFFCIYQAIIISHTSRVRLDLYRLWNGLICVSFWLVVRIVLLYSL